MVQTFNDGGGPDEPPPGILKFLKTAKIAKIRISLILSYIPSTDHKHPLIYFTICHTLEKMTLMVVAKVSQLMMMKERGRMRKAVTVAWTEMRALPQHCLSSLL